MEFLVPLKWSALRTEVDSLSGAVHVTPGRFGPDPAGQAALRWALHLAQAVDGQVVAATVGTPDADEGLRGALSLGATRAVRIEAPADCSAIDVADALAPLAAGTDIVAVGARSIDGGSAAVAPALAALLDRPAACGLLKVDWEAGHLVAERRLPAGRRERVRLLPPAVISVEAGTILLGRAALPALLEAGSADIEVVSPGRPLVPAPPGATEPYRPRPRSVPAPPAGEEPRERIAALTGALEMGSPAQQLELEPDEAAEEIVAALRRWGYLDEA